MFEPYIAYEASAGSGKTFNLVIRYLTLLFKGVSSQKILALTFTNKAANEMASRISSTLQNLEERVELDVLAAVLNEPKERLIERKEEILKDFLEQEQKIMTLDKFFVMILRQFAFEANMTPDFTVSSKDDRAMFMERFLTQCEVDRKSEELVQFYLSAQSRLSDMYELLDTIEHKQKELQKWHTYLEIGPLENRIENIIVQMQKIVENCPQASQRVLNAFVYESVEDIVEKAWLEKETLDYVVFKKCYQPELDILFDQLKEQLRLYYLVKEENYFYGVETLTQSFFKTKETIEKRSGELTFDSLTSKVYRLLKESIERDFLYFRLDGMIEHILLDEFQDTSIMQYRILEPLIEEIFAGVGTKSFRSFFYVGDVKQSIYRFRGGNSALFKAVSDEYAIPVNRLNMNYRSQYEIVAFVNRVFLPLIAGYVNQESLGTSSRGYVEVKSSETIIDEVVTQVRELNFQGATLDSIAILCATNADGVALEERLHGEKIAAYTQTSSSILHHRVIQGMVEAMKYLYFKERIYLENATVLLALEQKQKQFLEGFSPKSRSVVKMVQQLIEQLELHSEDINIIKWLEIVDKYKDLDAFIYQHERVDENQSSLELHGVKILTVHKSKGLEFEHVLVVDRLGKPPPDRFPFIFHYEGIVLKRIFLRMKKRALVDPEYAYALEAQAQERRLDSLNALYVALTRAKESLVIIRKEQNSEFELLNLVDGQWGIRHIAPAIEYRETQSHKPEYEALRYGLQVEYLENEDDQEEKDFEAIMFGKGLHYALEIMEDFSLYAIEDALDGVLNRFGFYLTTTQIEGMRKRLLSLVDSEKFLELIKGRVYKEHGLIFEGAIKQLDLAIEKEKHWVVIDYKSSKKFFNKHQQQVSFYRRAIEKIEGKPCRGYICYLLETGIELEPVSF